MEAMAAVEEDRNSSDALALNTKDEITLSIPVLCFISLLMIVGAIGNFLVILTYFRRIGKSSTNFFIFSLAVIDFLNCCFVLSVEFYNILNPFTNQCHYLCSIQNYMKYALGLSSGYIIVGISIDRYRRIARPHHGCNVCHAKLSVIAITMVSLILCSISLFIYGTEEVRSDTRHTVIGYRCGTQHSAKQTLLPLLFMTILLVCFCVAVLLLLVVYTRLGIKVRRWNKDRSSKDPRQRSYFQPEESSFKVDRSPENTENHQQMETFTFPTPFHESGISDRNARALIFKRADYVRQISRSLDKYDFSKMDETHLDGSKTLPYNKQKTTRSKQIVRRISSRRSGMQSLTRFRRRVKLSKTTMMFIAATVAFVASHIPYLCIKVIKLIQPSITDDMTALESSLFRLADYSFIISYGVNPLIYSFMNPKFRMECRRLLVNIAASLTCKTKRLNYR